MSKKDKADNSDKQSNDKENKNKAEGSSVSFFDFFTFKSDQVGVKYEDISNGVQNFYTSLTSDKKEIKQQNIKEQAAQQAVLEKEKFDGSGLSILLAGLFFIICVCSAVTFIFNPPQRWIDYSRRNTPVEQTAGKSFNDVFTCAQFSNKSVPNSRKVCSIPDKLKNQAVEVTVLEAKDLLKNNRIDLAISSGDHSGIHRVYLLSHNDFSINYVNPYNFGSTANMMNFFVENNINVISDGSQNNLTSDEGVALKGVSLLLHLF